MGVAIVPPAAPVNKQGQLAQPQQEFLQGSLPISATAAVNTAVVVTVPATALKSNRINSLSVSYNAAPTGGVLTVVVNAVTIFQLDVTATGPTAIPLPDGGLLCANGFAATVTLTAAGAAVAGRVNVGYFVQ